MNKSLVFIRGDHFEGWSGKVQGMCVPIVLWLDGVPELGFPIAGRWRHLQQFFGPEKLIMRFLSISNVQLLPFCRTCGRLYPYFCEHSI